MNMMKGESKVSGMDWGPMEIGLFSEKFRVHFEGDGSISV